jgi:hypothetical protein
MAETATIAASAESAQASSYRVKFDKTNFLELVRIARPKIIYRRKNMHFFAYDGFVMYCDQCENSDFSAQIIEAIEFSNWQWAK